LTGTVNNIPTAPHIRREVQRRRTFAIISHPDAGKTTLTEKLLLFGGAINLAGAVKAKKTTKHTTSDWMEIERQRGISVTSSVMNFEFNGFSMNLLDTPGHHDFSEDTYRVLTAVDSALMVIDSAKGVETQTKKLMDVCRMRNTPIITFINKLDREGRAPLELIDEIEQHLGIECSPLSWPIGMGKSFQGVYDIQEGLIRFFRSDGNKNVRPQDTVTVFGLDDPALDKHLGEAAADLRNEIELLDGAGFPFDHKRYLAGQQTPVFFGSAINNFGVRELLEGFTSLAPAPKARAATTREVSPLEENFSGIVFKVQANMDPAHRDRIAFVRICSGQFNRGMKLQNQRLGKHFKAANAIFFMAKNRSGVEEAWPGDIIGLPNHGSIRVGDTLYSDEPLVFPGIPHFAPEFFRRIILRDPFKAKQLEKGLTQLTEEGAIQYFRPVTGRDYILGAIGVLQFEIIAARLADEYNVHVTYGQLPYQRVRWLTGDIKALKRIAEQNQQAIVKDADDCMAMLFNSDWQLTKTTEDWSDIKFIDTRECVLS